MSRRIFYSPKPHGRRKWNKDAPPQTLHDLQKGWGLHDLQMDKGCTPPPTLHDFQVGQGLRAPQPFMTWRRLQMDKGWGPPQPFTTKMDKGWGPPNGQGLGPPNPDLQMHKGWGPTLKDSLHDLQMDKGWGPQPFTTCKWGGAQPFTTCKWTTVGQGLGPPGVPPITSTAFGQGLDPLNLSRFGVTPQINFTASTYVSKPTRRLVRRSTSQ